MKYLYQGQETNYQNDIRKWFPNKSLPQSITTEVLSSLGVEVEDVAEPVPTFEEMKEAKKASIAQARYEAEIAGVNGIRTDRESRSIMTEMALKAMSDPDYTCRWKGIDGFVTLTAPQIIAMSDTVRAYVQGCFDKEDELLAQIEIAETQSELDNIKWG